MVVLDDATVRRLAGDAKARAAFPFLARRTVARSCCGARAAAVNVNRVKMSVVGLDAAGRERLKALLNTDRVLVHYMHGGRLNSLEF